MTPGRVAYEGFCGGWEGDGANLPGWLQRPWGGLDYRRQSAWEAAAAAVIADSRVAWEAAMAALTADNDRLRAALQDLEGK